MWTVTGCQSVSRDTSGRLHLTCLEYAGDSTLYVGTSKGQVSAWDTRQNTCFMHWQADTDSAHEIGTSTLHTALSFTREKSGFSSWPAYRGHIAVRGIRAYSVRPTCGNGEETLYQTANRLFGR